MNACINYLNVKGLFERFGGWALYVFNGTLAYNYNFVGMQRYTVEAKQKPSPGKHTVKFDFTYDGSGVGKGGMGTLFIDGVKVGEGRIGAEPKSTFNGRIPKLVVEVK